MARRHYVHRYTVEGRGRFPIDMLRYDGSYPANGSGFRRGREFTRVPPRNLGAH